MSLFAMKPSSNSIGLIRDRTPVFLRFRNQVHSSTGGATPGYSDHLIDPSMPGSPQETGVNILSQTIDNQFAAIEADITSLQELHNRRIRQLIEDPRQQDALIEAKTQQISGQIRSLRDNIQAIGDSRASAEQKRIQKNMQTGYATQLRTVTLHFREVQADFIARLKRRNAQEASFDDSKVVDPDDDDVFDFDPGFTGQQEAQVAENAMIIRQRNEELEALIPMMNQLNEFFMDLNTLIIEQGTILDRIDNILDDAIDEIEEGNEELMTAQTHQKSKCFYIYMIIAVVVIVILIVVIYFRKRPSGSSTPDQSQESSSTEQAVAKFLYQ